MSKITQVAIYICDRCREEIAPPEPKSITTGYGVTGDGAKYCYPCCGDLDREYMISHGEITLYLVSRHNPNHVCWQGIDRPYTPLWFVTNWPNSLSFKLLNAPLRSKHNMARYRYDFWFAGPDGHIWHGYKCGDDTDIAHCKRTKTIYAELIRRK